MLDLIAYASEKELSAFVLSVDFQKCFDRIEFDAVIGAMEFFNCGKLITKWTRILYSGFTAVVQNNGNFSKRIMIERGTRQGGPCSCYYFL